MRERDRVVQRLRSMALDAVPADLVLDTAQRIADLAADASKAEPRRVPPLAPYAAGDQITVLTDELSTAAEALTETSALELLDRCRTALADLRRGLTSQQV